jgi:UDP-glucose 4-epimerase
MKVLVTGSGGFIGSAVKRWLEKEGHEAVPYDLPADVRHKDFLIKMTGYHNVEAVIHLAGKLGTHELFDDIDNAIDVNIKGNANVLEACRLNDMKFVGIAMPPVFKSIYTATKVAATWMASAYNQTYGVPVSHVRAFNAFGEGQHHGPGHPQKIIPTFAYNITHGLSVPVWGDGEQTVDLIYVDDLAHMLVDALKFGDDDYFDGGTGKAVTVNETIAMVEWVAGDYAQTEYLPMRRGERPTHIVATGEGWDKLGWQPEFRPEDLERTVDYYRQYEIRA